MALTHFHLMDPQQTGSSLAAELGTGQAKAKRFAP